jgi:hypothetical protein
MVCIRGLPHSELVCASGLFFKDTTNFDSGSISYTRRESAFQRISRFLTTRNWRHPFTRDFKLPEGFAG